MKKTMASRHYFFFTSAILALFLVCVQQAFAAEFTVDLPQKVVAPGSEFITNVWLNTEGDQLNAFEGTLSFPANLVDVSEIRDAGSLITVWITPPLSRNDGSVSFSGITPGGYQGEKGFLFSVVFRARSEGAGSIALSDLQALKNDGKGTAAPVSALPSTVSVSKDAPPSAPPKLSDTTPPESFAVQVAQSPEAFEGKNVAIFATQDKGSGMAYYTVCEGLFFAACTKSESPYVLKYQSADTFITVTAVDNYGNERSEHLFTPRAARRYSFYVILAILLAVGTFFAWSRFLRI